MSENVNFENCPAKGAMEECEEVGDETLKSLRKLRRDMMNCPLCPDYEGCPVLAQFHAAVEQVLLEIYEEWDLK